MLGTSLTSTVFHINKNLNTMLYQFRKAFNKRVKLSLFAIMFCAPLAYGQITGPNPVDAGSTHTYSYFNDSFLNFLKWSILDGTGTILIP
jgi:hypothetical protein